MVSITETTRVNTAPVHLNYTFPVTVKHTLKTVEGTQSLHFPLCNAERGISAVLPHMWSFTTAVKRIDFESESGVWYLWTGTLREDAKANWDVLEEALPDGTELDSDQLQLLMREWIAAYAADSDRAQQIEYVRTVKKPLNIDCKAFLIKLRNLNAMADLLPGIALVLDDDSLKRCFFNAMPSSWQTRFEHMGRNFETTEIKDLSQYFSAQERLASAKAKLTSLPHTSPYFSRLSIHLIFNFCLLLSILTHRLPGSQQSFPRLHRRQRPPVRRCDYARRHARRLLFS
jgi:hypothetical protein